MRTLHAERARRRWSWRPEQALAHRAGAISHACTVRRARPLAQPAARRRPIEDFDSAYFLDRDVLARPLADHPEGLVVAVPRTDLLLFAPVVDARRRRQPAPGRPRRCTRGGGDYRLSSALYLFKDDRWTVFAAGRAGRRPESARGARPRAFAAPRHAHHRAAIDRRARATARSRLRRPAPPTGAAWSTRRATAACARSRRPSRRAGRVKPRPSLVLYGIMFISAYLPLSRRTMPSISSSPSLMPSSSVHWYWIG